MAAHFWAEASDAIWKIRLEDYADALADVPIATVVEACKRYLARGKFWPKLSELRETINAINEDRHGTTGENKKALFERAKDLRPELVKEWWARNAGWVSDACEQIEESDGKHMRWHVESMIHDKAWVTAQQLARDPYCGQTVVFNADDLETCRLRALSQRPLNQPWPKSSFKTLPDATLRRGPPREILPPEVDDEILEAIG